ncbi:MAG: DUF2959 family protein [Planctomycetota bacterium]
MRGLMVMSLVFAVACGSTPQGQKDADKLNTAVEKLGATADAAESNLLILKEKYIALLDASGDLKKPYQEFDAALKTCEGLVNDMEKTLGSTNVAAATYFEGYEANLAKIESESVREQARGRLEDRRAAYKAFQGHVEAGIQNYKPLLSTLRDHATALGLELTPASVKTIASDREMVSKQADEWMKRNEAIKADVEGFLASNRPETEMAPEPKAEADAAAEKKQ